MHTQRRIHNQPQTRLFLKGLSVFLAALVVASVLGGCFGRGDDLPKAPEVLDTLPEDWILVLNEKEEAWRPINIDDDSDQYEFLLFYTYNNTPNSDGQLVNTGPSGVLIFDLQNNNEYMPASNVLAMPYQPSGSYIPYRPLPNYWARSGDGFVAPSGRHGQLTLAEVTRAQTRLVLSPSSGESSAAGSTEEQVKELLIRDGGKTITVIWWRDIINGYGAASVHAPSGFENLTFASTGDSETPLLHFEGYHPFHDRSELCNVIHYTREYLTPTLTSRVTGVALDPVSVAVGPPVDVIFNEKPLGIDFCRSIGSVPFYPESVVLKYLRQGDPNDLLTDFANNSMGETAESLQLAVSGGDNDSPATLRISGIFAPRLIPFQNRQTSRATVCVEFIDATASAEAPESTRRSAATFRLRHEKSVVNEKPAVNYPSTDEFRIEGAERIPSPKNGNVSPVDCNNFVENGTPGRVDGS